MFVAPKPGWRGGAEAGASDGSGGGAAAGGAGGNGWGVASAAVEDEIENPCPICLDNEDDATVDGTTFGMCSACGQMYCGACNESGLAYRSPNCPTCRAPLIVSVKENSKRYWKLVHGRSPGRYTLVAQTKLGAMYAQGLVNGRVVAQDHATAVLWFRRSAESGEPVAQFTLGDLYEHGRYGIEKDYAEACEWYKRASLKGCAMSSFQVGLYFYLRPDLPPAVGAEVYQSDIAVDWEKAIMWLQRSAEQSSSFTAGPMSKDAGVRACAALEDMNQYLTPSIRPPGTIVTTVLLRSVEYNNRIGTVVSVPNAKVGRAAVLLTGEAKPVSFKLMDLRVHP